MRPLRAQRGTALLRFLLIILLSAMVGHICLAPCSKTYGSIGSLARHQATCKDHLHHLEKQSTRRSGRKFLRHLCTTDNSKDRSHAEVGYIQSS